MGIALIFLATLFLAYSNGANDNFKGVATLFGSKTINYKDSLWLATITTLAGSLCSVYLSLSLIKIFSGKGLVPDSIAASPEFLSTVAIGAGLTIMLATLTGFPVSTTHSLTGALIGAGFMAIGTQINLNTLIKSFLLPLLLSPLISVSLSALLYAGLHYLRVQADVCKEWCVCVGETEQLIPILQPNSLAYLEGIKGINASIGTVDECKERYTGKFIGIEYQKLIDLLHIFSAGSVSFARGLNDTPKIAALLMAASVFDIKYGIMAIAAGMAMGGILNAHKVAQTMSKKIVPLNPGQGFAANLTTAILVFFASRAGMPVSTTHVSVGSISGIGLINKKLNIKVISDILLAWILTLPISAILSAGIYLALK